MRNDSYGSWWRKMWPTAALRTRRPKLKTLSPRARPVLEQLEHRLAPAMLAVSVSPTSVTAGQNFILTVQAEDSTGNPISMGGTVNLTSTDPQVPTLPAITLNSSTGFGYAADSLLTASGTQWTISGNTGSTSGTSSGITVTPAAPVRLAFGTQPSNTATGNVINPAVTVNLVDSYGNAVTSGSDSSDQVTLAVGSGPGSFTVGSTTTATMVNGVATFNNLTLVTSGTYTLSPNVPSKFVGANSNTFSITPLQVVPASFASSPTGFSVQFNAPFLVTSTTPVLYAQGFGATGQPPSVIVTTDPANLKDTAAYVEGSLILNTATNSMTFLATDTVLESTSSLTGPGSPVLPDGVYTVIIRSSAANNGFQAINSGGGFLDGKATGTAGSGDFTTSFTVNAAAMHDDVVWVPATADGPGQALVAPGQNQAGGGYPVYLTDHTGTVTDVQATLNYNPALLTVTPTSTATFTVTVPTAGTAVLHYSGPALAMGSQVSIGTITASVPAGTTTTPTPYKAKDPLHLSGVKLNSSGSSVVTSDGLHMVSYVGDADGNGSYSSNDAVLITRVTLQTDTGFTAYPLVDPVIVVDTDGSGFIPADAALQANEAGVGFPTANLASPPVPAGVHFQSIPNNVDPTLNIPSQVQLGADGTVAVSVNIDDPHPAGSTGLIEAHLALTYDPSAFTVSAGDIHLGSVLTAGSGWTVIPTIDPVTGQIAIALSSTSPITSALGGSLVIIDLHQLGELGSASARSLSVAPLSLVASVNPGGQYVTTELEDAQGTFTLTPAPMNATNSQAAGVVILHEVPAAVAVNSGAVSVPTLVETVEPTTNDANPAALIPAETVSLQGRNSTEVESASGPVVLALVHGAATLGNAGNLLGPLAGLVLQVANSGAVNVANSTWQRLADQLFQSLGRGMSLANDPSLVSSRDVLDPTATGQSLRVPAAPDVSDPLSGDEAGNAPEAWDLARAGKNSASADVVQSQASLQPAPTDQAAVDQYFAQTADEAAQTPEDE